MILKLDFGILSTLTNVEYDFLNFVNENPEYIIDNTIKAISEKAFISTTSIVRFSKKIGYESFMAFKYDIKFKLKEEQERKAKYYTQAVKYELFRHDMLEAIDLVDENVLSNVVDLITKHKVLLYGKGTNSFFLNYLATQLSLLDCLAIVHRDSSIAQLYIKNLKKEDTVIVLSISGETPQALQVAQTAKSIGCKVVAITEYGQNSLTSLADYILYIPNHKNDTSIRNIDLRSRFTIVYMIDIILRRVAVAKKIL